MQGFRFKEFAVSHERCAMKVGTDGVLLGAWCDTDGRRRVLDIGTGSGLIALMVAQRNAEVVVDAIDIDEGAVEQARENVADSRFAGRINVAQRDFRMLECGVAEYDLIVSNPPFFTDDTHSPDAGRNTARNAGSLPFDSLMCGVAGLLSEAGEFAVIVPVTAARAVIALGAQYGLYLTRRTDVCDSPSAPLKRALLAFAHDIRPTRRDLLVVHDADGGRSDAMRRLTNDFYL